MNEMREYNILTLLRAWHWARDHKAEYGADGMRSYPAYVVCLKAQTAIEQELYRRDHRAFVKWCQAGVPESCHPDKYFMPYDETIEDPTAGEDPNEDAKHEYERDIQ